MAREVRISVVGDASSAVREFKRTGDAADGLNTKMGTFGKVLKTGMLAVGVAAVAGAAYIGSFIDDAQEAARVTRVLDSQIKNLGPSGREAFASADKFAVDLGRSIGKDDDDIRKVLAKLASFPEAFKKGSLGADAMRRATEAAFDLEAIGIGTAESNIVSIGKALNDPIKGMTALSKSGVSFTAEQKLQIKNYIAQGKLAEAQAVLLAGIESNAKGAAKAAVSNMDRLRAGWDNFMEGLAGKALPAIEKVAGFITDRLLPAMDGLDIGAALNKTPLGSVLGGFELLRTKFVEAQEAVAPFVGKIRDFFTTAGAAYHEHLKVPLESLRDILRDNIVPAVTWLADTWRDKLLPELEKVAASMKEKVEPVMRAAGAFIKDDLNPTLASLAKWWRDNKEAIEPVLENVARMIGLAALVVVALTAISAVRAFQFLGASITNTMLVLKAFGSGINVVRDGWNAAWAWIQRTVSSAASSIGGALSSLVGRVTGVFGSIGSTLSSAGRDLVQGFINGITSMIGRVASAARSVVAAIPAVVRNVLGLASPSKVMHSFGVDAIRGMILGIASQRAALTRTMNTTIGAALPGQASTAVALNGAAGTANVTTINVNVPPASDPAEVGRQTVKALRAYETSTGRHVLVAT